MAMAGGSLRMFPRLHPHLSPHPEHYLDSQPLDFSTKKEKLSPTNFGSDHSDDSDRCSLTEGGLGMVANLVHDRKLWSRSSESGVSVSSNSPERPGSPRSNCGSPMAFNPVRHPHYQPVHHMSPTSHLAHSQLAPHIPASINSALFAQLHANPLLFSTLQSAIAKSKMAHPFGPYLHQPNPSPTSKDFTPARPGCPSPSASSSLGMSGLEGSGLGSGSFCAGGPSAKPKVQVPTNLSPNILGGYDGLGGLGGGMGYGLGGSTTSMINGELNFAVESNDAYSRFREQMLAQVTAAKCRRSTVGRKPSHNNSVDVPMTFRDKSEDNDSRSDGNIDVCGLNSEGGVVECEGGGPPTDGDGDGDDSGDMMTCSSVASNGKRRNRQNGDCVKDDAYWERRRKNNEAAKRSRDARRAKEDEIAIRAAFLEQENLKLRVEVASLKTETSKLRCLLYNS
ncbi:uncharacterized protein [Procambarus clarkii]|uniref:uncharacterized protein n=1 Tax=Procambarus clarkii TaxID=6728 RepID=UPI001E6728F5|nr:uncharacterized protein LOC123756909 [Procambarus clarkii]